MLTRLVIKNFKSIGETGVDLELKPLTLLIGPNGSGKSSVLEALCLLSQQPQQSEFRLRGELVQFSSFEEIAHKHQLDRWMSWEISMGEWGIRYQFRPDSAEEVATVIRNNEDYLQLRLEGDRRSGLALKLQQLPGGVPFPPTPLMVTPGTIPRIPPVAFGNILIKLSGAPFLNAFRSLAEGQLPSAPFVQAATAVDAMADSLARKTFLLGPSRGTVPSKSRTDEEARWVGVSGEKLVTILSLLTSSPLYEAQWAQIVAWAEWFGLLKLRAGLRGPSVLAADFLDPKLKTTVNLAFAGHGSRQVAPIITQLFWADQSSLIMIEEPEISLHPEAQLKLGELFAEAIKEDKQVIATTHSHFLLLALGRVVQKGLLKRDDIAVYHVTKDAKGTKTTPVKLSKRGYPLGWPPSFAKVESDLAREWARDLVAE